MLVRTDSTIPVDLSYALVQGDARRLNVLLWELQRSCLITTLRGLAPERRAVLTLMHVLGLSLENTAAACSKSLAAGEFQDSPHRADAPQRSKKRGQADGDVFMSIARDRACWYNCGGTAIEGDNKLVRGKPVG